MAISTQTSATGFLGGLARRLAADQLLSDVQARDLQQKALKEQRPFVSVVVESKLVSASAVAEAASLEFGVPLMDLSAVEMDRSLVQQLTDKVLRKAHALPIYARGKKMFIAVSDPMNVQALDDIKFLYIPKEISLRGHQVFMRQANFEEWITRRNRLTLCKKDLRDYSS